MTLSIWQRINLKPTFFSDRDFEFDENSPFSIRASISEDIVELLKEHMKNYIPTMTAEYLHLGQIGHVVYQFESSNFIDFYKLGVFIGMTNKTEKT